MKYDKTSISSIFKYSQKLIGHSLREIVGEKKLKASNLQGQGKGGLEQMIEELFNSIVGGMIYEKNNDRDCTSCFDAHAGIL